MTMQIKQLKKCTKKPPRINYKKQLSELLSREDIKATEKYDEICAIYAPMQSQIKKDVPKKKKKEASINYDIPAIKFMHNGAKFIIHNGKTYDETGKYYGDINTIAGSYNCINVNVIYHDKELGEFIMEGAKLYKKISDTKAIEVGEIVDDNVCIYDE
jgi:hypothetical protein